MKGAKRAGGDKEVLEELRAKRPKMPKSEKAVVDYGAGQITCRPKQKQWRVFMKAPYKVDLTRQWGPKGSKEQKFQEAFELIESKMVEGIEGSA